MNIKGATVFKGQKMDKETKIEKKIKNENNSLNKNIVPFDTVEEAWFWFILAQQAKVEGARYTAGLSITPRPCEPSDILKILNNLYRNRLLLWEHMLVLRHYGRRQLAPDPQRVKEVRAHKLWLEAMQRLEPALIRKKIMHDNKSNNLFANKSWAQEASLYSNTTYDDFVS